MQVADSLRARGYGGAITLVGEEDVLPYQRPPLSKDHLASAAGSAPLPLRSAAFFDDNGIDFCRGVGVSAIHRNRRIVTLDDGQELDYTTLVLATGAANRALTVPGSDLAGVHELRSLAHAERLRERLSAVRTVAVVGAGFIGLEFAAVARGRGLDVTVLEAAPRPMSRALSPVMSDHVAGAHRRAGIDLRLGEGVAELVGETAT